MQRRISGGSLRKGKAVGFLDRARGLWRVKTFVSFTVSMCPQQRCLDKTSQLLIKVA